MVRYDIKLNMITQLNPPQAGRGDVSHSERSERVYLSYGGTFEVLMDNKWVDFQAILGGPESAKSKEEVESSARLAIHRNVRISTTNEDSPGALDEYVGIVASIELITIEEKSEAIKP